ncbi:hypothetical protein ACWCQL_09835 [Streptomyces sp. NPDC002073]|uniref:hypothetical protein n=1 Tax=Streptomyces sp. NBC_00239 TaxID=2903640 RepID=UPI002E28AC6B|nr:hypothetical protein [Streptomyces sp. NBC_00239]
MFLPPPSPGGAPAREPVPFAFVAEADRFRSNVTPPPRERLSKTQIAARSLVGLTVVSGLIGALLFGMPALQPPHAPEKAQQPEAAQSR